MSALAGQDQAGRHLAIKAEGTITVDGILSEDAWKRAEDAGGLLYPHPEREDPSLVHTMVKVLYDDKNLYIGFLCIDKQPDMIIADVTEKDGDIRVDDSVYILLDIYENLSNFYYFGLK
jgi:hypothetical protein